MKLAHYRTFVNKLYAPWLIADVSSMQLNISKLKLGSGHTNTIGASHDVKTELKFVLD